MLRSLSLHTTRLYLPLFADFPVYRDIYLVFSPTDVQWGQRQDIHNFHSADHYHYITTPFKMSIIFLFFISYGRGSFSFSNLVNGITKRFSTDFELQEVCSPHSHNHTEGYLEQKLRQQIQKLRFFFFVFLCLPPAEEIQRRQPPCWFWLSHLGPGAGYREDHSQHQMGDREQSPCAQVVYWGVHMRTLRQSKLHTLFLVFFSCCFCTVRYT